MLKRIKFIICFLLFLYVLLLILHKCFHKVNEIIENENKATQTDGIHLSGLTNDTHNLCMRGVENMMEADGATGAVSFPNTSDKLSF